MPPSGSSPMVHGPWSMDNAAFPVSILPRQIFIFPLPWSPAQGHKALALALTLVLARDRTIAFPSKPPQPRGRFTDLQFFPKRVSFLFFFFFQSEFHVKSAAPKTIFHSSSVSGRGKSNNYVNRRFYCFHNLLAPCSSLSRFLFLNLAAERPQIIGMNVTFFYVYPPLHTHTDTHSSSYPLSSPHA